MKKTRFTVYVFPQEHALLVARAQAHRRSLADEAGLILAAAVLPQPKASKTPTALK